MFVLLDGDTSPVATPYSSATSAGVAVLALIFAIMAFRAAARRGNSGLRYVGIAFIIFALKNVFSAYMVVSHVVPHDAIELVLSVLDLAIMLLLFAPLLVRRRA